MNRERAKKIEVWAGPECSIVRIKDEIRDQLALTGHADRHEDIDLIASLGIKKIRYPVLWERVAEARPDHNDWQWCDHRLERLRLVGITPIVGLVHLGGGPRYTGLLDPKFPVLFADYAWHVAERYPWIEYYTPINEPLTAARFSCLYGHWHPHEATDAAFVFALLNQCRGIVLAMAAIRRINPDAKLVQTEDIGYTWSTPILAYQAEFENNRRFLSFDLLCGKVERNHPLWNYLLQAGATEEDLNWFCENACPPNIMGIDYYITGERFLDHRLERYPACHHGGNTRHRYADVEAVRVLAKGIAGHGKMLNDVWERYHLPVALTEVQLAGTQDEQLRWLMESWQAANTMHENNVDVIAITVWSLFGSMDWNSLLVRTDGQYESGVWDVRSARPEPTLLAQAITALAKTDNFEHPALDTPGWWRKPCRLMYPPV